MKNGFAFVLGGALLIGQAALAQSGNLTVPRTVEAGSAFTVRTSGAGKAVLYIVGLTQVLRRDIQLGETVPFAAGDLHDAGHYLAFIGGEPTSDNAFFDVTTSQEPAALSFLAKPSRLPVDLHDGISGVVYVFDIYQNLVLEPTSVLFQLSANGGTAQNRTVITRNGVAWIKMNSASKVGAARFVARAGNVIGTRVIQQVPGEPCALRMNARPSGQQLTLETEPVRDCSGNAAPDGTIVTFTETYSDGEATVDVPLKRGIARTELPAHDGATISVATGVVMGNEIHWGSAR